MFLDCLLRVVPLFSDPLESKHKQELFEYVGGVLRVNITKSKRKINESCSQFQSPDVFIAGPHVHSGW